MQASASRLASYRGKKGGIQRIDSLSYYELLGVDKNSAQREIKKNYYALALKYHPDKNVGDEEAAHYFKRINEAYQVLSDPRLKRQYDETGAVEEGAVKMDPREFFSQVFGGGQFEDIVGDFFIGGLLDDIAQQQELAEDGESCKREDQIEKEFFNKDRIQKYKESFETRVTVLANKLLDKIGSYEANEPDSGAFRGKIQQECDRLKREPNAKCLLATIGYVYYIQAKRMLGKYKLLGLPSLWTSICDGGHLVKEYVGVVKSFRKLSTMNPKASKEALDNGRILRGDIEVPAGEPVGTEEQPEDAESVMDLRLAEQLMKLMGKVTCLEIEMALRRVFDIVFEDKLLSRKEIIRRSQAVKVIGKMYLETSRGLSNENEFIFCP